MRRIYWSLVLGALSTFAISAATLVPGPTDSNPDTNFTFTINTGLGTLNLATPGAGDMDTLTVSGVGNFIITDASAPGSFILSLNGGFTEAVGLTFNTAGVTLDGSGNALLSATGAALTSISDPALAALIGASTFTFAPTGSQESPFVFDFVSADLPTTGTPEPAVSLMVGIGLLGISALRLRKRSN